MYLYLSNIMIIQIQFYVLELLSNNFIETEWSIFKSIFPLCEAVLGFRKTSIAASTVVATLFLVTKQIPLLKLVSIVEAEMSGFYL